MTERATSHGRKQASDVTESTAFSPLLAPTSEQDLRIPLSSHAVFWRPRHLAASPMLGQIPFLFWLVETIRPRTVVQFGIGDGVVYMALCQVSERFGDSTVCTGLQMNGPLMPSALREQHDAQYSDFSVLLCEDPGGDPRSFGSEIDLLVLNQALDPEILASFQSSWLPRLSDRSVVVICHPEGTAPNETTHQNLFPDKERMILRGPVSPGGYAVEAVLYGKDQPERLVTMAAQRPGKPAYLAARQVFNRLGQGIEATLEARSFQQERSTLLTSLQAAEAALKTHETKLIAQQAEVKAAQAAEEVEISRQAEMSARLYDLEEVLSRTKRENADLSIEAAMLRAEIEALGAVKDGLEAELTDARTAHEARIEDIAVLTRTLEAEHAAALKAEIEALGAVKDRLEAHTRERDDLRYQIDVLTAHRDALLTSTSWRITKPMRGVKNVLSGRRNPVGREGGA